MIRSGVYAFTICLVATQADAHARLKPGGSLAPRNESSSLKSAPCGNIAIDELKRTELSAGSQLTIKIEETIHHKGSFKIYFSEDGTGGFEAEAPLATIDHEANPSPHAANPNLNDPSTYIQMETTITVPDVECESCVLQLVQIMTDRTPPSNYYSCADVKIVKGPVTTPSPGPTPGPSPTPVPPEASVKPETPKGLSIQIERGPRED